MTDWWLVHVDRFLNTSLIETWIFVGSMPLPWKRQGSPVSSFDHITTGTWASHTYLQTPAAHEQHPHNYISQLTLSWDGNSNVLPYQLRWDQQEGVTHSGFDLKNQNGSLYIVSWVGVSEWVSFTFRFSCLALLSITTSQKVHSRFQFYSAMSISL